MGFRLEHLYNPRDSCMLTGIWLARFDYANLVIGEQIVGVRNLLGMWQVVQSFVARGHWFARFEAAPWQARHFAS
jgi:hypothetical protein